MKRSVFALALSMGIFTMHAQNDRTALEGTRPGDNWSIAAADCDDADSGYNDTPVP